MRLGQNFATGFAPRELARLKPSAEVIALDHRDAGGEARASCDFGDTPAAIRGLAPPKLPMILMPAARQCSSTGVSKRSSAGL